jgi:DNA replication protein DnaC
VTQKRRVPFGDLCRHPGFNQLVFNRKIWRTTMNSTATTMTPSNSLTAQLLQIGLRALPANLDEFLEKATKDQWSPHTLLAQLAHDEAEELFRRRLKRRLRVSGIKTFKPMEDFDWEWPSKIERDVVECALNMGFLHEARNLVLMGPNGLGKTMIAQNICHNAMLAGCSVLFRTATTIVEEFRRQSPDGRRRKLRAYANVGLLCIDEVGYLAGDAEAADLLCEVISRRYERKSVLVTTNRPFEEWDTVFPKATCVPTLLDRLLHHADTIVIEGRSFRARESEQESAARAGKG